MTSLNGFRNLDGPDSVVAKCFAELRIPEDAAGASNTLAVTTVAAGGAGEGLHAATQALPDGQQLWAFSPTPTVVEHPDLMVTVLDANTERLFADGVRAHLRELLLDQELRASNPDGALARSYCPDCEWVGLREGSHAVLAPYRNCDPNEVPALLRA